MDGQFKEKVASFEALAVAIDESTDITDIFLLAIFIRGVDANLTVTEEFVQLLPMTGTTKVVKMFDSLIDALDSSGGD